MRKPNNWEATKATGDFERPSAGGYICRIVGAVDNPDKEYLELNYDIIEGDYANYWADTQSQFGWWGGKFYRSYKEKALGMFKAFTNAIEASNANYTWDWNEQSLVGKTIGLVLGEEEYIKNDGSVGTRLYIKTVKNAADIRAGKFKVPELKAVEKPMQPAGFTTVSDDDTPF